MRYIYFFLFILLALVIIFSIINRNSNKNVLNTSHSIESIEKKLIDISNYPENKEDIINEKDNKVENYNLKENEIEKSTNNRVQFIHKELKPVKISPPKEILEMKPNPE